MDVPISFLESESDLAAAAPDTTARENVVPISDSLRSQTLLRERERRFRELLDALPAAVYTTDAAGRITYYNDSAAELWGYRPPLGSSEWCGSWKLFWPDGTPMRHDECPMALALKQQRAVRGMEATAERPDGTRVPFIPYPTPIRDGSGKMIGAVNMLVDITDRKLAEEQQAVLVRELHHRVKNTLATVQAIMGSTARSVDNMDDFTTALFGRIQCLARTHLLLADERAEVGFMEILKNELDAFDDGNRSRVVLSGPEVPLSSQLAVSLAMAIHELTTNAAKWGALSVYGGKVAVTWSVTIEATRRILAFDWIESGGPQVTEPTRQGFGTRLLDFVLPGQVQAMTQIEYAAEGIRLRCALPLPQSQNQNRGVLIARPASAD
ncbi:MAG TPA: HWE histidine kinase domain-containing protein [Pseudolabrys sp.]|nr:HWE histidine kinase domain-containing protein [Pseudolabrys sp.]